MNINFNKTTAVILTLVFTVTVLIGCKSEKDVPQNADSSDTEEVIENFENGTGKTSPSLTTEVAIVNGDVITESEFSYYILNAAAKEAYSTTDFNGDLGSFDWNKQTDNGQKLSEKIIDDALNTAIGDVLSVQKANEFQIGSSESELKENEKAINEFIEQSGNEVFALTSLGMGISSIEDYKMLYNRQMTVQKLAEDIILNPIRYIPEGQDFEKYRQKDSATVKHILITNDSKKSENPKALAEDILQRAKDGEDFSKLIKEFNEDPGQTDAGYTFGTGQMVKEFEDAAFALGYNEISDIVETSYGYHIIKRLIGIKELEMLWTDSAEIEKNEELINKFSVEEIITNSLKAQKALEEKTINGGDTNE